MTEPKFHCRKCKQDLPMEQQATWYPDLCKTCHDVIFAGFVEGEPNYNQPSEPWTIFTGQPVETGH